MRLSLGNRSVHSYTAVTIVYFRVLVKCLESGRLRSVQSISPLNCDKAFLEGIAQSHRASGRAKARSQEAAETELLGSSGPELS